MTESATFQNLSTFTGGAKPAKGDDASAVFVAWAGFGAVSSEATADGVATFRPAMPMSPDELKQQRMLRELEEKRAAAMQEITSHETSLEAKSAELAAREQAIQARESELESLAENISRQSSALSAIAQDFELIKKGEWAKNADEIVDFSLALVEKLVMDRLVTDPTVLVRHIRTVLEEMKIEEAILIHLCPDDLDSLKKGATEEIKALVANPHIKWVGDLKLEQGEVHIDTSQYRLDASLQTALRNLGEDLRYQDHKGE